jgi:hypothetical protein
VFEESLTGLLLRMKLRGGIVRMIFPKSPWKHEEHPFQLISKSFLESHLYAACVRHKAFSKFLVATARALMYGLITFTGCFPPVRYTDILVISEKITIPAVLTPHSSPEKLVFSPSTKFPPAF